MSRSRARVHDFYPLFTDLRAAVTDLPFEVGGATQMGQLGDHHNNQDAVALITGSSHLVAVVSDGCASAGARHSHNEVGAKFQAMLLASMADEVLANGGVSRLIEELSQIENRLLDDLRSILAILSRHPGTPCWAALSDSFFTATLLAAAIDSQRYVVLGCGDGVLWINDQCIDLDAEEGLYLSARFADSAPEPTAEKSATRANSASIFEASPATSIPFAPALEDIASNMPSENMERTPMLRVLSEGLTSELNRLFLGTDGFIDVFRQYPMLLDRLAPIASHSPENRPGYNQHLVTEFRRKFWYDPTVEEWAQEHGSHDDRTFALFRRVTAAQGG